jgi:hypothetical protein
MQAPHLNTFEALDAPIVRSSGGQHYRRIWSGRPDIKGRYPSHLRRCDSDGNITPRIRQSKKQRIKARRAA